MLQRPKRHPGPLSTISRRAARGLGPLVTEAGYTSESSDSHGPAGSPQDQNDAPVGADGLYWIAPYSPPSPPSQLMPPPPDDCQCCNRGLLNGHAEQYWEDHIRQEPRNALIGTAARNTTDQTSAQSL